MNNCIKNCFSSENRGHRSGGRGFSLLFYGFVSSELVGCSPVHELRAGGFFALAVHELRAGGSFALVRVRELRAGGLLPGSRAQSWWVAARFTSSEVVDHDMARELRAHGSHR